MSQAYADIRFTPAVLEVQRQMGTPRRAAAVEPRATPAALTPREAAFIGERDGFHLATVSESGWPYVQFRGGPPGFLHTRPSPKRSAAFAGPQGAGPTTIRA